MIKLKADCIAERSFDDNIDSMLRKNKAVIVSAIIFIFLYIAIALGHFPSRVHCRFWIALVSIFVIVISFMAASGTTFYWDQKLTPLTAEVVPIILLAVGLDSLFIINEAEQILPATLSKTELRLAYALKDV
jgi:predicted RND superfamily exporter protein